MKIDYELALEMANGFGFILTFVLMLNLIGVLIGRIIERRWSLWSDVVVQLAIGMILVKAGLSMRLGYGWMAIRYPAVETYAWILFVSTGIIAVGGLLLLNVLTCARFRPWLAVSAGMASFLVPFIYYAFDLMFPVQLIGGDIVQGTYDLDRVILSILIAVVGSYTALEVAQHAQVSEGFYKAAWTSAAAIIMGWSIWSMHFVAMLAYNLPGITVHYNLQLTILSLVLPIALTMVAFLSIATTPARSFPMILFSGLVIGCGVVGMHYIGMAAMEMSAVPSYDLLWVVISVVIAAVGSIVAVWIAFLETTQLQKLVAAVVMGVCGISGLHYSAMVAFQCHVFPKSGDLVEPTKIVALGLSENLLAAAVTAVTFLIIGSFLGLIAYERKKGEK